MRALCHNRVARGTHDREARILERQGPAPGHRAIPPRFQFLKAELKKLAHGTGRLVSLDAFRGLTIAGMILVNNPGTWSAVYGPLTHADWHGWTPTDLIFPFFLFAVGVSIALTLAPRLARDEPRGPLLLRIVSRSAILFALGLFLAGFPQFDLTTIRIPGVLQRIAVCYLGAALLFLATWTRHQAAVITAVMVGLLLGYWALMTLVPAPGFGAGDLSKEGNLAAHIDRTVLGPHIWRAARVYDPEGILSTLPAIATTLAGVLAGQWLGTRRPLGAKATWMAVVGLVAVIIGLAWSQWFPINKALWTSSYALFTAGAALVVLAACFWLVEIRQWRRWAAPFVVFGTNAIAAFVLSTFVARLLVLVKVAGRDGEPAASVHRWLYTHLFAPWAGPANASLLFAVAYVLVWLAAMWALYRRRVFIRV
jgi:predicted acyltransferase